MQCIKPVENANIGLSIILLVYVTTGLAVVVVAVAVNRYINISMLLVTFTLMFY